MAESIFKNFVKKYGADCKVASKGLCIDPNNLEVNEFTKIILKQHNITPVTHKASKLTTKTLKDSTYVVCMTENHKQQHMCYLLKFLLLVCLPYELLVLCYVALILFL